MDTHASMTMPESGDILNSPVRRDVPLDIKHLYFLLNGTKMTKSFINKSMIISSC